jgi:hypothetical protein
MIFQQIMTDLNGAEAEENRTVDNTESEANGCIQMTCTADYDRDK